MAGLSARSARRADLAVLPPAAPHRCAPRGVQTCRAPPFRRTTNALLRHGALALNTPSRAGVPNSSGRAPRRARPSVRPSGQLQRGWRTGSTSTRPASLGQVGARGEPLPRGGADARPRRHACVARLPRAGEVPPALLGRRRVRRSTRSPACRCGSGRSWAAASRRPSPHPRRSASSTARRRSRRSARATCRARSFDPLGLAPEDPAEFKLMQEKGRPRPPRDRAAGSRAGGRHQGHLGRSTASRTSKRAAPPSTCLRAVPE